MCRIAVIAIVVIVAAALLGGQAVADWPKSIQVGGFAVTDVRGTTNPDGSGRATGKVQIPGAGGCPVDLARSATGIVTGSTRSSFSIGGVRVEGSFMLDSRGFLGTGTIHIQGRPVSDANLTVNPKGRVFAKGSVRLSSGFCVPVTCEVRDRGVTVSGSGPREASLDTPLALYKFKGDVIVSVSGTRLKTSAKGNVERKGKIGGMVSTFGPLVIDVDPATGDGQLNVGGAGITIHLW